MEAPPRNCSQCGNNGHNARTCTDSGGGFAGIMLFGVRLTTAAESFPSLSPLLSSSSAFRKSVSMNNLSQYEQQPQDSSGNAAADGYASDDALHASGSRSRERKRGISWTEEEHKLFLMGLKKVGKGDWRGISRNFVKTRTPTQVASHAQKYFLRRSNVSRRRRRTSLFDITTDTVTSSPIEEESLNQDSTSHQALLPPAATLVSNGSTAITPTLFREPLNPKQTCPAPLIPVPPSSKMANLNLNQSPPSSSTSTTTSRERELEPFLSLRLSSSAPSDEGLVSRASAFGEFNSSGDSIISVA